MAILKLEPGAHELYDIHGLKRMTNERLVCTETIRAGRDAKDVPSEAAKMEGLFGKGVTALKARVTDLKPQFDYQAEMLKKLGVELPPPGHDMPMGHMNMN